MLTRSLEMPSHRKGHQAFGTHVIYRETFLQTNSVFFNTFSTGVDSMEFWHIRTHITTCDEKQTLVQDERCQSGPVPLEIQSCLTKEILQRIMGQTNNDCRSQIFISTNSPRQQRSLVGRYGSRLMYVFVHNFLRMTCRSKFCRESCRLVYKCSLKWQEFDSKWDGISLSTTKIPPDDILEGLYKLRIRESDKLKTELELYDLETHQKKLGPDSHRLKAVVKRSIEQEIRNKNFGNRSGNFEKNAVVKNQGTKTACTKNSWRLLAMGIQWAMFEKRQLQFPPRYSCVLNWHNQTRLRILSCSRMSGMRREPEVPEGKSRIDRMSRWRCKDCFRRNFTNSFSRKWHPPRMLVLQVWEWVWIWYTVSDAHRQVGEQRSKKSKKNGDKSALVVLKNQWVFRLDKEHVAYTLQLRIPGHGAVEIFIDFMEEFKHEETDPMCKIHESHRKHSRPKSFVRNDLPKWISSAKTLHSKIWGSISAAKQSGNWPKVFGNWRRKTKQHSSHLWKIGAYLHQL